MSSLYGPQHRALQDQFDTRRIADKLAVIAHHTEITEQDRAFIESRDLFWLASVDHEGRPTVSYKGGDPGLVRVLDASTLAFPSYDGNGMFYSMGNIAGQGSVGLLFMDMEKPFRLRVQGTATSTATSGSLRHGTSRAPAPRRPSPDGSGSTWCSRTCPAPIRAERRSVAERCRSRSGSAKSPAAIRTPDQCHDAYEEPECAACCWLSRCPRRPVRRRRLGPISHQ
jgi:predicted pyridoxine 5'-phosphate oxidase superfamily flavin-nucleotide-binding protein